MTTGGRSNGDPAHGGGVRGVARSTSVVANPEVSSPKREARLVLPAPPRRRRRRLFISTAIPLAAAFAVLAAFLPFGRYGHHLRWVGLALAELALVLIFARLIRTPNRIRSSSPQSEGMESVRVSGLRSVPVAGVGAVQVWLMAGVWVPPASAARMARPMVTTTRQPMVMSTKAGVMAEPESWWEARKRPMSWRAQPVAA
jgi:hypothetical protein